MTVVNFEWGITKARALKAKINTIKEKQKEELAPYNAALEKLENYLLDALNKTKQDNASTPAGGCHKIHRISVSLENPEEFKRHVIGAEAWDLLDWKANVTAVDDYLLANAHLPPGVKRSEMLDIGLTAPRKKKPRGSATPKSNPVAGPNAQVSEWDEAEALAEQMEEENSNGN